MKRRLRYACAAAAAALVAATTASARPAAALEGTISYAAFTSRAVKGTLHYAVYLPPGYSTGSARYPVVYFLHGLPASSTSYESIGSIAAALERAGDRAIVIGVQGSRAGESDPEWLDRGAGHDWETATAKELVSVVDGRYRTIATRAGRMIVGISGGGYGATLIALHNPGTYSAVESWSGYFHATNPAGTAALDLGSTDANDWANANKLLPSVRTLLGVSRPRTYFAFYVGTDDKLFRAENDRFYRRLRSAGLYRVVFRLYRGGHDWALWNAHAASWLHSGLSAL